MGRLFLSLLILVLLILTGGAVYLYFAEVPANPQPVEKVIPSDRFGQ